MKSIAIARNIAITLIFCDYLQTVNCVQFLQSTVVPIAIVEHKICVEKYCFIVQRLQRMFKLLVLLSVLFVACAFKAQNPLKVNSK